MRGEIISRIKETKYYSILFDCTPDASRKEQMSEVIRYVRIKDGKCTFEESFIDFIQTNKKTGASIADEIITKLVKDKLEIGDIRGQGYDNGANMAGKYNGAQAHILKKNNLAKCMAWLRTL